jgi:hypothetical protein
MMLFVVLKKNMVNGFWEFMKKDKNAVIIDNILKIKIEERIPVK